MDSSLLERVNHPFCITNRANELGVTQHKLMSSPLTLLAKLTSNEDNPLGPRPFKYFNAWETHHSFEEVIKKSWNQPFCGTPIEELLLRQKSRQVWLKEGDRNTKYFYSSIKARASHNTIRKVKLENGEFSSDPSETFAEFGRSSGLSLNPLKSQLLCTSNCEEFSAILGIPLSAFPVKHLGLPLQTSTLTHSACAPLIDKVGSSKIHAVSWDRVCLPKIEGGLGVMRLSDWNSASMGVRFWEIASNSHSLWASWMRKRYLKQGKNIWTAAIPSGGSSALDQAGLFPAQNLKKKRESSTSYWSTLCGQYGSPKMTRSLDNGSLSQACNKAFGIPLVESLSTSQMVLWLPPSVGWVKINSNGSRCDDRFGYGAIVRDPNGDCLAAAAASPPYFFKGPWFYLKVRAASIDILELKGLVEGLHLSLSSMAGSRLDYCYCLGSWSGQHPVDISTRHKDLSQTLLRVE
ncbi:hypothetical protein QJS10_CPB13g01384 [Acorus calamus]|uniref:Uncharacterized protein n=1 Tax=Acorus calamus TaxID=4465 RepID=A0AAV9DFI8_ACOCL|nr:hypothetical protein QJS10_CPB13g01384 [Acorus calamus]